MKNICLECITLDELIEALKAALIMTTISETSDTSSKSNLLSRKETAGILKITLATLNAWTKQGKIISYRKGTRVYYKEDEIIASLEKVNHQKYKKYN